MDQGRFEGPAFVDRAGFGVASLLQSFFTSFLPSSISSFFNTIQSCDTRAVIQDLHDFLNAKPLPPRQSHKPNIPIQQRKQDSTRISP